MLSYFIYNKNFDIINNLLLSFPYVKNVIMVGANNLSKFQCHPSFIGLFSNLLNLNNTESEFLLKLSFLIFFFNLIMVQC